MTEGFKEHLPIIIVVSLVGFATGAIALLQVRNNASALDVGMFSFLIIVIPCLIMFICSLIVAMTAKVIGRQLYVTMLAVCLVLGVVSMVATSMWMAESDVAAALLANSAEGATIMLPTNSPLLVMRNIAAYVVMPTLGCIAGAWIGSRMHPVQSEGGSGKGKAKNAKGAKPKGPKK